MLWYLAFCYAISFYIQLWIATVAFSPKMEKRRGFACHFFPKKFTEAERASKVSNLVMGCSFITEGAIPFAASDPAHVIPCTLVGAGVAGGLSAFFGCTLMAPHGGIFVFATVGKPLLYILSWIIGSIVTTVMLGFIKKDAQEV